MAIEVPERSVGPVKLDEDDRRILERSDRLLGC